MIEGEGLILFITIVSFIGILFVINDRIGKCYQGFREGGWI